MGTEQEITVQAAGLFDSGNNPYALPPGALLVASDVEITRDNVIQGRRGMAKASADQFVRFANFQNYVVGLAADFLIYRATSPFSTWTAYGTPPSTFFGNAATTGAVETARSLFWSTSAAVIRIDSTTGTPVVAGLAPARDLSATVGAAGTAVRGQTRVAYRVVFGRKDSHGRLIYGAPSGRVVFTNTNASTTTNDVALSITLPGYSAVGLTSTDFVQIYRTSGTVDIAATTDPGDECYLVAEVAVPTSATVTTLSRTASTVTATTSASHGFSTNQHVFLTTDGGIDFSSGVKVVTGTPAANQFTYTEAGAATTVGSLSITTFPASVAITDSQPDGTGGASLYTNPSQETILNQNVIPPGSGTGCLAMFGNCLWVGYPIRAKTLSITMLAVPAAGVAITEAGAFTAGASEDAATKTFQRYTAGTTYENIRDTAASFARVYNRANAAFNVYAITTPTDTTPGQITFFNVLSVTLNQPSAFASNGASLVTANTSQSQIKNGLIYSKPNQPDHFSNALVSAPIRVGSESEEVKRIVPTRSALFIFKNDGVWKATGQNGEFQIQPLDPTTSILAPESAVALDNAVYLLTDQGFARVTESGVEIISRSIEQTVSQNFDSSTIACASEADHKYRAWCGTKCVVFDPWTKTWTERSEPFLNSTITAVINERTTGRLLVSGTSSVGARSGTYVENVSTLGDSLGETVVVSTADEATTQNTYTVTHAASTLVVGDTLELATCSAEVIQATDATHSIVLATEMPAAGTYAIYRKTGPRTVSWQIRPSKPGTLNEWQELVFHFLANVGQRATVNLATDFVTSGTTNIDLDLIQTRLTNGDGFNQIRVWPAREDSLSAVLVATLSWASSRADIRLAGLTTRFVPSSWQVSR